MLFLGEEKRGLSPVMYYVSPIMRLCCSVKGFDPFTHL
jgi:hypothetical protein